MGRAALIDLDDQSVRLLGVNWSPKQLAPDAKEAPENNPWGLQIDVPPIADMPDRYWAWGLGEHPALVGAGLARRLEALPSGAVHFQLRRGPGDVQKMVSFGTVHLSGPAHVLEDESVFTDVYTAASIIYPQRSNYCTQLNLKLAPGGDREQVRKEVQQFLKDQKEPGQVQTVEANEEMTTDVTAGLELGFSVGGYLALLVGMFLVYNALSVSVAERRHDIGILRSVGATRAQVAGLFVGEASLLGLTGSLLGLPLGYGLAWLALKPMEQVLSEVFVKLPATTVSVSWPVMLLALGAGMLTAVLASLLPALQAADEQPADAVRRAPQASRPLYSALQAGTAARPGGGRRGGGAPADVPAGANRDRSSLPICFMGAVLVAMPLLAGRRRPAGAAVLPPPARPGGPAGRRQPRPQPRPNRPGRRRPRRHRRPAPANGRLHPQHRVRPQRMARPQHRRRPVRHGRQRRQQGRLLPADGRPRRRRADVRPRPRPSGRGRGRRPAASASTTSPTAISSSI